MPKGANRLKARTMSIGDVGTPEILAEVRRWRGNEIEVGGDLPSWTHADVQAAALARAESDGGQVVSSGGTTGRPKLMVVAPDLGVPRLVSHWRPLHPGDVLLNLFSTGKMWGAHYLFNALAVHCRSTVVPLGALNPQEFEEWAGEIVDMKVNAVAGAPNVLARFAGMVRDSGVKLPVRTVIWAGEPMTRARKAAICSAFPEAGLWGVYASTETFVIGVSRPECRLGAIHLLPGQRLEPDDDDGALLTRVGEGWPIPALRFRLGDRIRAADCPCGARDAFEILGRVDDNFKLYGVMVRAGEVLDKAESAEGVDEVQLVLYHDPDIPSAVVGIRLRYTGSNIDAALVRDRLVRGIEELGIVDRHTPEAITVDHVSDVERSPRTNKVLPVLWCAA